MKELLLSQYIPRSELRVEHHHKPHPYFSAIDVHTHFGQIFLGEGDTHGLDTEKLVEALKERGIKHIVNLDGKWGGELSRMLEKTQAFGDFITTFGTVDVSQLDDMCFEKTVRNTLRESRDMGIKGLKFWKNIGLGIRDKSGLYIPVDDDRLSVIWETAAELKLPVLIHIADPIAFFKPIDETNERYEELLAHPDWSFEDPCYYRFQELMAMQERLLQKNPKTTFILAHMGSCAEDLSYVGKCLSRYPNMYVDMAMRISELGRQPYTARKFFEKYQDRILFGTDSDMHNYGCYNIYYRFMETYDEYFDYVDLPVPNQGRWKIYGIGLEEEILEKVYAKNAERIIGF